MIDIVKINQVYTYILVSDQTRNKLIENTPFFLITRVITIVETLVQF
jgi:hypothetical protein